MNHDKNGWAMKIGNLIKQLQEDTNPLLGYTWNQNI